MIKPNLSVIRLVQQCSHFTICIYNDERTKCLQNWFCLQCWCRGDSLFSICNWQYGLFRTHVRTIRNRIIRNCSTAIVHIHLRAIFVLCWCCEWSNNWQDCQTVTNAIVNAPELPEIQQNKIFLMQVDKNELQLATYNNLWACFICMFMKDKAF